MKWTLAFTDNKKETVMKELLVRACPIYVIPDPVWMRNLYAVICNGVLNVQFPYRVRTTEFIVSWPDVLMKNRSAIPFLSFMNSDCSDYNDARIIGYQFIHWRNYFIIIIINNNYAVSKPVDSVPRTETSDF